MPEYMHRALIEAYVRTAMFQELPQEVIERTLRPWTDAGGQAAFYRQIAQADDRYTREVEPHYSRLQQPTLILWGAEDSWIPADRGHRLASMLPDASLHVIDSAGHLVIEEKPKRLLEEISGFFGDQRGVIG
jgi:pimeloyl-ACP methyl ester carboxylesterase